MVSLLICSWPHAHHVFFSHRWEKRLAACHAKELTSLVVVLPKNSSKISSNFSYPMKFLWSNPTSQTLLIGFFFFLRIEFLRFSSEILLNQRAPECSKRSGFPTSSVTGAWLKIIAWRRCQAASSPLTCCAGRTSLAFVCFPLVLVFYFVSYDSFQSFFLILILVFVILVVST